VADDIQVTISQDSIKQIITAKVQAAVAESLRPYGNKFVEEIRAVHAPAVQKGKVAKIMYATQAGIKPTTFVLFVNQKKLFHFSYMRFIENRLREKYGFEGVPVRLELREEKREKKK
jgi:predicted GTPase